MCIRDRDESCNYNDQKQFIDLAATMGYEYVLIDALWDTQIGSCLLYTSDIR